MAPRGADTLEMDRPRVSLLEDGELTDKALEYCLCAAHCEAVLAGIAHMLESLPPVEDVGRDDAPDSTSQRVGAAQKIAPGASSF